MGHRTMSDAVANTAEAFRRSLEFFESDPETDTIGWRWKDKYVWIRATPGLGKHLSGKDEEKPKLYLFDYQRAKSESDTPPEDEAYTAVLEAWQDSFERRSPRLKK